MVKLFREMKISSRVSAFWLCLMALFAVVGHWIPLPDPREFDIDASAVGPFSPGHLLGTDAGGYDLLSNIVNGARTSLLISIVSVGLGGFIGSVLGILAAYRRGRLDYIKRKGNGEEEEIAV